MTKKWGILNLSKDNLKKLYKEDQLSAKQIGLMLGHDEYTVRRYLRYHHIELRTHSQSTKGKAKPSLRNPLLTKEALSKLYNDEWLTTTEIGEKLGCNRNTVLQALKRHNIPLHTSRVRGMDSDNLHSLYIDQGWSLVRIANHLGCNDEAVRKALSRYNIPIRTKSEAGKSKHMSEDVRAKVIGNLVPPLGKFGADHPSWKGGRYIDSDGYVRIRIDGKVFREHRYVMSQSLGRPLEYWEEVNHINGLRTDNRLENLELIYSEHKHKDELRRRGTPWPDKESK